MSSELCLRIETHGHPLKTTATSLEEQPDNHHRNPPVNGRLQYPRIVSLEGHQLRPQLRLERASAHHLVTPASRFVPPEELHCPTHRTRAAVT